MQLTDELYSDIKQRIAKDYFLIQKKWWSILAAVVSPLAACGIVSWQAAEAKAKQALGAGAVAAAINSINNDKVRVQKIAEEIAQMAPVKLDKRISAIEKWHLEYKTYVINEGWKPGDDGWIQEGDEAGKDAPDRSIQLIKIKIVK